MLSSFRDNAIRFGFLLQARKFRLIFEEKQKRQRLLDDFAGQQATLCSFATSNFCCGLCLTTADEYLPRSADISRNLRDGSQ